MVFLSSSNFKFSSLEWASLFQIRKMLFLRSNLSLSCSLNNTHTHTKNPYILKSVYLISQWNIKPEIVEDVENTEMLAVFMEFRERVHECLKVYFYLQGFVLSHIVCISIPHRFIINFIANRISKNMILNNFVWKTIAFFW